MNETNEQEPIIKNRHKKIYIGTGLAALAIVIAGGFVLYRHIRYENLYNAGLSAMNIQDYSLAKTDFASSLHYSNDSLTDVAYQKASILLASQSSYKEAQIELQKGKLSAALNELEKVIPQDQADYSAAEKQLQSVSNLLYVSKTLNDLNIWSSNNNTLSGDLNAVVNSENALPTDTTISSFQSDLNNLSSNLTIFNNNLIKLQYVVTKFNTDGQLISNPGIKSVINSIEQAMNTEEDDLNNMYTDASLDDSNATQIVSNWYYNSFTESNVLNWDSNMSQFGNEENIIYSDIGKLKAYAVNTRSQIGNPTVS